MLDIPPKEEKNKKLNPSTPPGGIFFPTPGSTPNEHSATVGCEDCWDLVVSRPRLWDHALWPHWSIRRPGPQPMSWVALGGYMDDLKTEFIPFQTKNTRRERRNS